MKEKKKTNFYNWSIDKGDYKRDETTTWRYHKKLLWKKRIKNFLLIVLYIIAVSIISYLIFS